MAEHFAAGGHDAADDFAGHLAVGNLDGRFDHRKREAFDAESVMGEVALFSVEQAGGEMLGFGIIGQQFGKMGFGQPEEMLVFPKRIVGVKADGGEGAHGVCLP